MEHYSVGGVECIVKRENYNFSDGKDCIAKTQPAIIYETPDGTRFVFPEKMDSSKQTMTPEQAIVLWQKVPEEIRQMAQKTVEFVDYYNPQDDYWKKIYKNFTHSYATGGEKITFYRFEYPHDERHVIRTYCHEIGHHIDTEIASQYRFSSEDLWTEAMKQDIIKSNKKSPTEYGENSCVEDFAESIAEYIADKKSFKENFPNRAAILELVLSM